jgi:predicted outer membrane repeat protein
MSNCNFTDNVATDYGGVIDCVGDYCTIENCNFINNNAVSKAGVIRYYHDNLAYIKNSNFINNRVADGSSGGGVIYVDDGAVAIDKSVFIGNVANDKPGSVLYTPKSATVTNSIFLNNPGAYSIYGGSGVELTNNWFGNTSSDYDLMVNNTVSVVYPETTLNNWLYLDIKFLDNQAIVSLNNAYDKSSASTGVISNYNLPELTLNINSTTLGLNTDKVTLDASGKAGTYYTKLSDDAKLTVSNEYVSLTSDVCDFDILQGLIDEYDEIELSRDYVYSIGDSITEGIAIGKSIVIDGKGHIIDANQQSRIFKIIAGNVTLKNINFINGHADFAGAIWCENSNLTIIGCNFSDNDAYEDISYGGAVVFNGDKLTVDNSRFISNKAKYGGAVIIENAADAKLMNTEFSENGADEYGALGIFSDNILIDYCTFDGNYANKSVGALYFAGDATVNNTIFKRNSAKEWGALFYNGGAGDSLVIDYCQFIDNDCYAVYLYSTHARILNSQFMNSTSEDGFAIYNGAMNELYLSNNTISTDNVEIFTDGGNISSQVTVTILDNKTVYRHLNENVLVYLTFCDDNGNLIQVQGFDLLANNTKINYIYNNLTKRYEANFTSDEIWSYIVTVSDAHLSNLALKNGEIDIVNVTDDFLSLQRLIGNAAGTLTLTKDYIFNPLTDVDFVEGIVINKGIAIDGAGFTIDAKNQARILKVLSDNVTIKNIAFINANSTEGGAIYWETGSNALVSDCNFTNNSAYYGGAIYIEDANLTVNNSHFINSSSDSGCTIFNSINAKLILSNSIFESDCLKGRTIDNNYGILYLHNNTINTQSAEIFNYGGEILSPCTAVIKTTVTTFVLGDKTKFTAVIADDNGNLIEEYYYVYFNAGGKLIESTYDSTKCVYESEYVFDAVGLLKVVVSCPSINITDNFGVDITVLKHDATITANDASYSINYGGKYSITVKDSKGNAVAHEKVTFTLNGKSVGSATTDSKGVATITLAAKTLKTAEAGKKNLVIKLTSSKYNTVAKTVKITINKDKTKIVAKNKEFKKSKKTKKYVMTLKDSKGKAVKSVKVTLNVKGKTFTAKTNSKGKATFKITSLTKKGKFKATIKFKGDDYYKLSTKKVTIKNK